MILSIRHDVFVTILKYGKLSDLVKLVILSKECTNFIQHKIESICEFNERSLWVRAYLKYELKDYQVSYRKIENHLIKHINNKPI